MPRLPNRETFYDSLFPSELPLLPSETCPLCDQHFIPTAPAYTNDLCWETCVYHQSCIFGWVAQFGQTTCPVCRTEMFREEKDHTGPGYTTPLALRVWPTGSTAKERVGNEAKVGKIERSSRAGKKAYVEPELGRRLPGLTAWVTEDLRQEWRERSRHIGEMKDEGDGEKIGDRERTLKAERKAYVEPQLGSRLPVLTAWATEDLRRPREGWEKERSGQTGEKEMEMEMEKVEREGGGERRDKKPEKKKKRGEGEAGKALDIEDIQMWLESSGWGR
ncbi:hypothetical protein P154DRAFT_604307 [Amniculicola lignicola CBS 123094]|uniref:RING-type domain-containing protein n=1 Tax=Amniculicola lignicola CBS 123094 TaxID=1392246 RepID=A0A6A5WKW9_9PLEO|nr:hypothetical protein P154DRAFT_604307 [Amniculicola lignicola CBS 123094]